MKKVFKVWIEEDSYAEFGSERLFSTLKKANQAAQGVMEDISHMGLNGIKFKMIQHIPNPSNTLISYYDEVAKIGVYIREEDVN